MISLRRGCLRAEQCFLIRRVLYRSVHRAVDHLIFAGACASAAELDVPHVEPVERRLSIPRLPRELRTQGDGTGGDVTAGVDFLVGSLGWQLLRRHVIKRADNFVLTRKRRSKLGVV